LRNGSGNESLGANQRAFCQKMTRNDVLNASFRVPVNNFFKRVKRFRAGIFFESLRMKTRIAAQKRISANVLKVRAFSFQFKRRVEFSLSIENWNRLEVSGRNSSYFRA
jgi:hypothetical protein